MVLKGERGRRGREVKISIFGGTLLLFDFEDSSEAERVLARGSRRLKVKVLHLE